jgi:hypothetical protein
MALFESIIFTYRYQNWKWTSYALLNSPVAKSATA